MINWLNWCDSPVLRMMGDRCLRSDMKEVRTEDKATPFGDRLVARPDELGELVGIEDGSSNLTRLFEPFILSVTVYLAALGAKLWLIGLI